MSLVVLRGVKALERCSACHAVLLRAKVEIIGLLVGDATLMGRSYLCAGFNAQRVGMLCLGWGGACLPNIAGLGAIGRPGWHTATVATPSSTMCSVSHLTRENCLATRKMKRDGMVVEVELCGEDGGPESRVRPRLQPPEIVTKEEGSRRLHPESSAHVLITTTFSLSIRDEAARQDQSQAKQAT